MSTQAISIALCLWSLALGINDQVRGRLPNLWLAPAILFAMFWALRFGQLPTGISVVDALGGIFVALLLLLPGYIVGQVGAGDVKCLASMGLFVGPVGVLVVIIIGYAVIAGVQWWTDALVSVGSPIGGSVPVRLSRRRLPLGPGLALGFIVYLLAMAPPATALTELSQVN